MLILTYLTLMRLYDIDWKITGWPTMFRLDGQTDEATVDIRYLSTGTEKKTSIRLAGCWANIWNSYTKKQCYFLNTRVLHLMILFIGMTISLRLTGWPANDELKTAEGSRCGLTWGVAECLFYRVPEHCSCHEMSQHMRAFYAIKVQYSGTRQ